MGLTGGLAAVHVRVLRKGVVGLFPDEVLVVLRRVLDIEVKATYQCVMLMFVYGSGCSSI
jgi:hypothetical protein